MTTQTFALALERPSAISVPRRDVVIPAGDTLTVAVQLFTADRADAAVVVLGDNFRAFFRLISATDFSDYDAMLRGHSIAGAIRATVTDAAAGRFAFVLPAQLSEAEMGFSIAVEFGPAITTIAWGVIESPGTTGRALADGGTGGVVTGPGGAADLSQVLRVEDGPIAPFPPIAERMGKTMGWDALGQVTVYTPTPLVVVDNNGGVLTPGSGTVGIPQLTPDLAGTIGLIDGPASVPGTINARLAAEAEARRLAGLSASAALIVVERDLNSAIVSQGVRFEGDLDTTAIAITALEARADGLAQQVTTLQSTTGAPGRDDFARSEITRIDQVNGAQATSISQVSSRVDGQTAAVQVLQQANATLGATYNIKTDVNGKVVGFGITNNGQVNGGVVTFRTDVFAIETPGATGRMAPFTVGPDGTTRIADAAIGNASIGSLKIANAAVSNQWFGAFASENGPQSAASVDVVVIRIPIFLPVPGIITIGGSGNMRFDTGGNGRYSLRLFVDGVPVAGRDNEYTHNPSVHSGKALGAGDHVVQLNWRGQDGATYMTEFQMTVDGSWR